MIIIVMGTSGSGKSTVGKRLADVLGWIFVDADIYHSPSSIQKMSHGIPLTDEDRRPWLLELRGHIERWLEEKKNVVMACSALKAAYRELLIIDKKQIQFVYLKGSFNLFRDRIAYRQHHYMPEELLQSQFDILEEPPDALTVNAEEPPNSLVQTIRAALHI